MPDATPRTALVVDDDSVTRRVVVHGLRSLGFETVLEADDGKPAFDILRDHDVEIVVTDLSMRDVGGIELMRWALENAPGPTWIILSGIESFDAAVDAIHVGAFDFLSKPPDLRKLEVAIRNAMQHRELLAEKQRLVDELHANSVELLQKVRELEHKSDVIKNDLRRAEVIQRALLPAEPPSLAGCHVAAVSRPGECMGGDLYDVVRLDDRQVALFVADATGHGVCAAMLAVLFEQHLELRDGPDGAALGPAEVLGRLNRALAQDLERSGLFLTAAVGLLDVTTRELRVASAGHPPVLVTGARTASVERTGPALGLAAAATYEEQTLRLDEGDRVFLFTDGVVDGIDDLSPENLAAILDGSTRAATDDRLRDVLDATAQRVGTPDGRGRDDMTIVQLALAPGTSAFDNTAISLGELAAGPTRPNRESVLWEAIGDERASFALHGRATWTHANELFQRACRALAADKATTLDLTLCEYLDSTMLGTVHELVCRGADRVVRPTRPVRDAFEELGMARVLDRVTEERPDPPATPRPVLPASGRIRESQLRLLQAHEALASIGAENREKFRGVVDALRAELGL